MITHIKVKHLGLLITFVVIVGIGGAPFLIAQQHNPSEAKIRSIVNDFQHALEKRDIRAIEPLFAQDLVVLENGYRNDGWLDFRDNHLIPEMKEPATPSKTELIKVTATDTMGWAYTKTVISLTRQNGEKAEAELWSVFVVEKRETDWKIVLLDWSMRVQEPPTGK